jgi:pimeloyl-ACP methyl ester carboxylesterase
MPVTLIADDVMEVTPEGFHPVRLDTDRGPIEARHYPVPGTRSAVIWVGGVGGGFDTPARGLYPRLARSLQGEGIASLRVQFRHPTLLREAVHDVMAGAEFLRRHGADDLGLVGHSFGGAVAAQAAGLMHDVHSLVLLATQSYGAAAIAHLGPRCPVLLIHGAADEVLPPSCSESVFALARHPKKLEILPEAGHLLDEAADEVEIKLYDWLRSSLGKPLLH